MKRFAVLSAMSGFLVVGLGAFGAHGLEGRVTEQALQTWQTAVQYHMFHTLVILMLTLVGQPDLKKRWSIMAARCFLIGIVVFSGSLYLLVLTGFDWLGAITPIGGFCFLMGWLLLLLSFREVKFSE